MIRNPELPCLPGFSFNYNIGQTRFHKSQLFELMGGKIPYLSNRELPGIGGAPLKYKQDDKFPSMFARGEVADLPSWVVYDKQVLCFDGYYLEPMTEGGVGHNYVVHKCKIYFFLEDGTVQVVEKELENSGMPQGTIIGRQRIRIPSDGSATDFYDVIDFNIGREIEFFGKVFKLTNCDVFTRRFLNRLGISVSDPLDVPPDPYMERRSKADKKLRKSVRKGVVKNLLEMDNRILAFEGFWDDTVVNSEGGYLHLLKILYFLADGTMEVQDITEPDSPFILVKRGKMAKKLHGIPRPGELEPMTLLNVLGPSVERSRSIQDPLNAGFTEMDYYTEQDLAIGAVLNSYGRRFVISNMDNFTKEFYRIKYGIEDFTPYDRPLTTAEKNMKLSQVVRMEDPPYNGFGSYEDSLLNCRSIQPFAVKLKGDLPKPDKQPLGYDSRTLRFTAKLVSDRGSERDRAFVISYYMCDNTISIYETVHPSSGRIGGMIFKRRKVYKPGQEIFSNKPREIVKEDEFFLGNSVILDGFTFLLTGADEYSLKYMETHPNEFPKSNIRLILAKVREGVRPRYKEWVSQCFSDSGIPPISFHQLRNSLKDILEDKITDHEILILGRHFAARVPREKFRLDTLRSYVHDELKRGLYNDLQRLREGFLHLDAERTGKVDRRTAATILKGARVPLPADLVHLILEKFAEGERCEIKYDDLIQFFDYTKQQADPIQRISFAENMSWQKLARPDDITSVQYVDVKSLIDELQLEKHLEQQSK